MPERSAAGGRAATQGFFRLFTVPGMGHCGGGEGASQIDYLAYLEAWVYPYPQYARYAGTGDVNDARNFIAVTPAAP